MHKLTKSSVEKEQPSATQRFIWDGELKGFGVKIFPTGVKSFIFQYRTREGKSKRLTIGKLSDTLTVDQARKIATERMREVLNGIDPQGEKKARKLAPTLSEVITAYLLSDTFKEKAESTRASDMGRINRHLLPLLGKLYADKLTTNAVKKAIKAITDGETATTEKTKQRGLARVHGGAGTARKAFMLLRAICKWSTQEGTPAGQSVEWLSVRLTQDGQRETIIEDVGVYGRLFQTLDQMQNEKRLRDAVADAIRVIALTGARRGEIAGLRWKYVDLKGGKIVLPAATHKSGHRSGKAKTIALPTQAQTIISRQPDGKPDDFVFRPSKGVGALSLNKPWRDIRAEAKLPADLKLHSLRHSIASHLAMDSASPVELMKQLGHQQVSTTLRYIHFAENARSTLAERAAAVAVAGMEGKTEKAEVDTDQT
jgi:integrase